MASFYVAWCLLHIFFLTDESLNNVLYSMYSLGAYSVVLIFWFTAFAFAPYCFVTTELYELGKEATVAENLKITFARLAPLILVYFTLIFLMWYPADGELVNSLSHTLQNPKWFKLSVWAIVIYFVVSGTVKKPYHDVITAFLGLMAANHLEASYVWYRFDDGCYSQDGYTTCEAGYVQHLDRIMKEAENIGATHESLIAAELFVMLIYCLSIYVVGALIKDRFSAV